MAKFQRYCSGSQAREQGRAVKRIVALGTMTDNSLLSSLKSYLEQQVSIMKQVHSKPNWKYNSIPELVLDLGVVMETKPLPPTVVHGSPKLCYHNCQQLVFNHNDLTYVEGYAIASDIPFPIAHAWLSSQEDGSALDPTWRTPGETYWGIPFATNWLKVFLFERNKNRKSEDLSVFEGNYLEKFSLLREGLPTDAIAIL